MSGEVIVRGGCPGCLRGGLAVGNEGHIRCTHRDCPDPRAADRLLRLGTTGTGDLRSRVRAKISDAYYDARNNGATMETAADDAADAVVTIFMRERERVAHNIEELPGLDGEALWGWPSRHAEIYQLAIEEAASRARREPDDGR